MMGRQAAWLASLKPGDRVGIVHSNWSNTGLGTVDRVLKAHVVLKSGGKFRLKDGFATGETYPQTHISEPTPEGLEKIERERLERQLRTAPWHTFDLTTLRTIYASVQKLIIRELPKEQEQEHE
jgi:hypothetical protein